MANMNRGSYAYALLHDQTGCWGSDGAKRHFPVSLQDAPEVIEARGKVIEAEIRAADSGIQFHELQRSVLMKLADEFGERWV